MCALFLGPATCVLCFWVPPRVCFVSGSLSLGCWRSWIVPLGLFFFFLMFSASLTSFPHFGRLPCLCFPNLLNFFKCLSARQSTFSRPLSTSSWSRGSRGVCPARPACGHSSCFTVSSAQLPTLSALTAGSLRVSLPCSVLLS